MDLYNRKAKQERRVEKKLEYGRTARPITENIDLHESFEGIINQISKQKVTDKEYGLYQQLLINLRRAYGRDQITKEVFDSYKRKADDIIDNEIAEQQKQKVKQKKKEEKEKQKAKAEAIVDGHETSKDRESNTPEVDFNKKKVRGEESLGERLEPKNKEAIIRPSKWETFREFIGSPVSRILLFVILAVFLMFYITKTNMANIISSPIILLLAILFILLVLGKGGKTRTHNYSDGSEQYR